MFLLSVGGAVRVLIKFETQHLVLDSVCVYRVNTIHLDMCGLNLGLVLADYTRIGVV